MNHSTWIEASSEGRELKTRDHHKRDIRGIEAAGESPSEPDEAIFPTNACWQLRDLRACTGIVLVFQTIYLAADWGWSEVRHQAILPLHIFNILTAVIFPGFTYLRGSRNRMAEVILGGCTVLFATTTALSILTLNRAPLTFTLTITMVGAAALVPWNWRWQAGLATVGIGSMAAFSLLRPGADPHLIYDWFALVAGRCRRALRGTVRRALSAGNREPHDGASNESSRVAHRG